MSSHASQAWSGDPAMCNVHGFGPCDCHMHRGCVPDLSSFKIPKLLCDACDEPLSPEDQAYERTLCAACKAVIKSLRTIITE